MSRWFRWYDGTCEDGKFRVVARNASVTVATVMGVWAALLEDASHFDHRGIAVRGEPFWASILDLDESLIITILSAMESVDLISVGHGAITITKWKDRQFENDTKDGTNADRQRRWREKRNKNDTVTARNGDVTAAKLPDTDTDTDTDTERKKEFQAVAMATRPSDSKFQEFKRAFPRRKGANPWKPAQKVWDAALKRGVDPDAIIAGAKRCGAEDSKKIGTEFIPQAVKWLRDERWADYGQSTVVPLVSKLAHGQPCEGQIYIRADTPEWDAWCSHLRDSGGRDPPRYFHDGWKFPARWPPGEIAHENTQTGAGR